LKIRFQHILFLVFLFCFFRQELTAEPVFTAENSVSTVNNKTINAEDPFHAQHGGGTHFIKDYSKEKEVTDMEETYLLRFFLSVYSCTILSKVSKPSSEVQGIISPPPKAA